MLVCAYAYSNEIIDDDDDDGARTGKSLNTQMATVSRTHTMSFPSLGCATNISKVFIIIIIRWQEKWHEKIVMK